MVEVHSAISGNLIVVFEKDELADASILKQRLAQKLGVPRFRLRLFQNERPLDDNQALIHDQTLTLVILEFLPPDREQDEAIMVACEENDDKLLEQHLNQPRNPNFEDANAMTPLCAASLHGSLNACLYW